jgi:hypothetical protein
MGVFQGVEVLLFDHNWFATKTYVREGGLISMPSKRDLLRKDAPSSGPNWSRFQWRRIFAFIGGVSTTILYFWANPFQYIPAYTVAAVGSVPVEFLLYSFSSQSWQTCTKIAASTAIGIGLGTYF